MTGPNLPDDWSPGDQAGYDRYRAEKAKRNERRRARNQQPEPIRAEADWRQASRRFQDIRRDGDAFRDAAFAELGLDDAAWRTERHSNTGLGPRRYDIGRHRTPSNMPDERVGYEFKLGGGDTELTLIQLDKDELNLEDGWDITWVCNDMSRLSKAVRDQITALQQDFPDHFRAYDLAEIRTLGEEFQPQSERDRQAQKLASMEFTPPSRRGKVTRQPQLNGATATSSQVPRELQQAAMPVAASQHAPATAAPHPPTASRDGEAVRTGSHQAAVRRAQAHGTAPLGAAINDRALNAPGAHRASRGTGSRPER